MKIGFALKEITPWPGITLSGFAARRNRPSIAVDDPLYVRALAIEDGEVRSLVLVFDLLALGTEMDILLHAALDTHIGSSLPRAHRIFCTTHTHSAPAVITLLGCGIPEITYWRRVVSAAVDAAEDALSRMRTATCRITTSPVKHCNYNRRRVLKDGRVVMAQFPDAPVRKTGPDWERFLLARFDDEQGKGIVGIASWAAHPDTVCTQNISADYPGELCRGLQKLFDIPFIYLQGACADLNPPFQKMNRQEMLANAEAVLKQLGGVKWTGRGQSLVIHPVHKVLPLRYARWPTTRELEKVRKAMAVIARDGTGPEADMRVLANVLNMPPGQYPPREMAQHFASSMYAWSDKTLERIRNKEGQSVDLAVTLLEFGKLALAFVAAEVFVETALALQAAFSKKIVNIVSYGCPLVGYLPTDEALKEGGYESDTAYRFYNHPAPFARGSEKALVALLKKALR